MSRLMRCLWICLLALPGTFACNASGSRGKGIPSEVRTVLAHVQATGEPLPGYVGGRTFGNFERRLPACTSQGQRIRYREWDIHPKLPGKNRGPERLVTGDDHRAWYTPDHYTTFVEVR